MAKSPQQLGATAVYEPFRQSAGHKGLADFGAGQLPMHLGATKAAFLGGAAGLVLPGLASNHATTPGSAALAISGPIDVRARLCLEDYTPTGFTYTIGGKWTASPNLGFYVGINATGNLVFSWSIDGQGGGNTFSHTASATLTSVGVADLQTVWLRWTFTPNNGSGNRVATFYYSLDGAAWTVIGIAQTGAVTTMHAAASTPLAIGSRDSGANGHFPGRVLRFQILNGIDGPVVFDADPTAAAAGASTFAESSSNAATVTVTGSAADAADPTFDGASLNFDGGDYASAADRAALAFGASFTGYAVVKAAAQATKGVLAQYDSAGGIAFGLLTAAAGSGARVVLSSDGGLVNVKDYTTAAAVFDNTWHSVIFTFTGGVLRVYVDGVEDAAVTKTTDATVASLFNSTAALTLGATLATGAAANQVVGSIAAAGLLPAALSSTDVAHLHDYHRTALTADGVPLPAGPSVGGASPLAVLFPAFGFGF